MHSKAACKRTQHCWPTTPSIVGCYMLRPLAHPVACCCVLLRKAWNRSNVSANNSQHFFCSVIAEATMLDPFAQLFQHCWGNARSLRILHKDLWVVSFPRCTAGPKLVGSCCIRLHTTDATTPNIVCATLLGVVASVCMHPEILLINDQSNPLVWHV